MTNEERIWHLLYHTLNGWIIFVIVMTSCCNGILYFSWDIVLMKWIMDNMSWLFNWYFNVFILTYYTNISYWGFCPNGAVSVIFAILAILAIKYGDTDPGKGLREWLPTSNFNFCFFERGWVYKWKIFPIKNK